MADVTLGISHLMSPAEISAFPLNHPTARNAMPLGLLSPRAGIASPRTISAATAVLAADLHHMLLMTSSPPLQPRRLHASELINYLLRRQLDEPRPPEALAPHEADPAAGRLLVALHRERQRRRRDVGRHRDGQPRPPQKMLETLDGRRGAHAERARHARRSDHPDRDGVAVQERAGLRQHLERMPDRVAQLQHRPP